MLYLLALLQPAPEFLGNLLRPGPLHVKTSGTGDGDGVAVTQHIVVYPVSIYHIRAHLHAFPVLRKLHKTQFKGQFRRNGAQRSHHPFQSLGANQGQRLHPLRIAHGK